MADPTNDTVQDDTVRVYIGAEGAQTPPLLMTPPAAWKLKTFAKVGIRSVGLAAPKEPVITNVRTDQELDPGLLLGDAGLLPYDVVIISSAS